MMSRDELSTIVVATAPGRFGAEGALVHTAHLATAGGLRSALERFEALRPGVSVYVAPSGTRAGHRVPASQLTQQSPDEILAWAAVAPGQAI